MQRKQSNQVKELEYKQQVQPARRGPVPLDPSLFNAVSGGGSPRGGWMAAETSSVTVDPTAASSPRGGW